MRRRRRRRRRRRGINETFERDDSKGCHLDCLLQPVSLISRPFFLFLHLIELELEKEEVKRAASRGRE